MVISFYYVQLRLCSFINPSLVLCSQALHHNSVECCGEKQKVNNSCSNDTHCEPGNVGVFILFHIPSHHNHNLQLAFFFLGFICDQVENNCELEEKKIPFFFSNKIRVCRIVCIQHLVFVIC